MFLSICNKWNVHFLAIGTATICRGLSVEIPWPQTQLCIQKQKCNMQRMCRKPCSYLPSSASDVAVAASAQAIAVALSQEYRFTGLVAAQQLLEPGDARIPKGT